MGCVVWWGGGVHCSTRITPGEVTCDVHSSILSPKESQFLAIPGLETKENEVLVWNVYNDNTLRSC